jgi:hypothetical protein
METVKSTEIVVFHRIYDDNKDELSVIFKTLHELRKTMKIKYTHGIQYLFIKINKDNLKILSEHIKFQVSKYYTVSEYKCSENNATKLSKQLNTFIFSKYDKENEKMIYTSRIPQMEHLNEIVKIFNNAQINFSESDHKNINKNINKTKNMQNTNNDDNINTNNTNNEQNDKYTISYKDVLNK